MAQPLSRAARERAAEYFEEQRALFANRVDRSFVILMLVQYLAGIVIALGISPGAWASTGIAPRWHILAAILLGGLFTGVPLALMLLKPRHLVTRHAIAAGQMCMSGLLIHLSGGRIETHFHVFGSLAFLAFYRDWRLLATASGVVVLDLIVRGSLWPMSIFGTPTVDHWRWLEHTGWVIFEDAFLFVAIRHTVELLQSVALRRAELEQARDTAEQASRAKDDFMAVLSHELRTPLTPSLMTLGALEDDTRLDERVREEVAMVRRNVELEARLIDDLLDLTRIESGKLELSTANVDVHALLRHILQTCRAEFDAKQLTIVRRLDASRSWVYGDGARLQQVFWNLLKNAVKFTPTGGRIEVKTQDSGEKIRIDVIDSGMGIEPEVLPKIFKRFEQGGTDVTRQFGGLGLGLSIARAIVEMHRGAIRAESRGRGWGTTFTVAIPARAEAPTAVPNTQTQKLRLSGALPRRVLLVDDHFDTRETLAKLLKRSGYEVATADCVTAAKERAAHAEFDILVSDLGLPDGHGCDLMRELHERYGLPGVAFSGYGMEGDVQRSLEAGFSAHLTKPVDFLKLKEAMGMALSGSAAVR